jgi:hypothetical protein
MLEDQTPVGANDSRSACAGETAGELLTMDLRLVLEVEIYIAFNTNQSEGAFHA